MVGCPNEGPGGVNSNGFGEADHQGSSCLFLALTGERECVWSQSVAAAEIDLPPLQTGQKGPFKLPPLLLVLRARRS